MRLRRISLALLAVAVAAGCAAPASVTKAEIRPQRARAVATTDPDELAKRLIAIQPQWPRLRRFDCARLKCVALTFDDGPGEYTGHLLDLLRDRQVKATFFVLGQMVIEDRQFNVRRMVAEGHELGNHSWSHEDLAGLSEAGIRWQLGRTQDLVEQLTGVRMRMMRPPYGSTNDRVAGEARREGLAQIMWSVDTLDWQDRQAALVARRAGEAEPGAIVLLHDIHRSTIEAVPHLVDSLAERGFTFVTVSELYGRTPAPGRTYPELG